MAECAFALRLSSELEPRPAIREVAPGSDSMISVNTAKLSSHAFRRAYAWLALALPFGGRQLTLTQSIDFSSTKPTLTSELTSVSRPSQRKPDAIRSSRVPKSHVTRFQ